MSSTAKVLWWLFTISSLEFKHFKWNKDKKTNHVPFLRTDRLAQTAQGATVTSSVWVSKSVQCEAEKSPGEPLFYRIELKHLSLLYNRIIIILLSEFQRSSVDWPFLKYFSQILSDLNFPQRKSWKKNALLSSLYCEDIARCICFLKLLERSESFALPRIKIIVSKIQSLVLQARGQLLTDQGKKKTFPCEKFIPQLSMTGSSRLPEKPLHFHPGSAWQFLCT